MFTSLRRFEFGKMMLNLVPVIVATGVASRLFTEFPISVRIALIAGVMALSVVAILVLPKSLDNPGSRKGE